MLFRSPGCLLNKSESPFLDSDLFNRQPGQSLYMPECALRVTIFFTYAFFAIFLHNHYSFVKFMGKELILNADAFFVIFAQIFVFLEKGIICFEYSIVKSKISTILFKTDLVSTHATSCLSHYPPFSVSHPSVLLIIKMVRIYQLAP